MIAPSLLLTGIVAVAADAPITLDATRQLFLDDVLIASKTNVTRKIHAARKHPANPVLWPTEPWEGKLAITYGSVIRDDGRFRMWYLSGPGVSYAESDDGIAWRRLRLDLVEIDGHRTNAIILRSVDAGQPLDPARPNAIPYFRELFGVHKDPREPDPSRRYKMGFLSLDRDFKGPRGKRFHSDRRGLGVAGSPDGLHWTLIDNWATEAICDGATHWMLDPKRDVYVLYGRTKYIAPEVAAAGAGNAWFERYHWGRAVARVESPDFVTWNITAPAEAPVVMAADDHDPVGTEIYSMMVFPYEGVYIGLVQVFHNQPDACYLDIQLAVSRDSVHFTRVGDRSPFIPPGPVGAWDRFNHSPANNPPLAVGDELWFYYGGRTYRHSPYRGPDRGESGGGVGLATLPRDRFVSLQASFDGGEIVTRPVKLAGRTLHLNATADFGTITVELVDPAGNLIARAAPIRRDALDIPVQWEQPPPPRLDDPVSIRIRLENALLYALWCE